MVRLRDFRSKGAKTSTLIFEAKYYLVGLKIILMALCSIFLQTGNSLLPSLELALYRTSSFPHKLCPWFNEQDQSHPTLSSTESCPKLH